MFNNILSSNILSSNILSSNILSSNILSSNILSSNILSSNILSSNILSSNILSSNILSSNILSSKLDLLVYFYSTPNIKLYYPEPFISTPTFIHDDIWFLHISIYQYWLWFFFIFIIVFFFLVFLITLRWCNIRYRPVRETRGVSRSKCGDLITAVVPISWATSIIVHESTDAIEFNDGFGSTDLAIGIRAYQWGWEYYYPKNMDFNFIKKYKNLNIGNSFEYKINNNSFFFFDLISTNYIEEYNLNFLFYFYNNKKIFQQDLNNLFNSTKLFFKNSSINITYNKNLNLNIKKSYNSFNIIKFYKKYTYLGTSSKYSLFFNYFFKINNLSFLNFNNFFLLNNINYNKFNYYSHLDYKFNKKIFNFKNYLKYSWFFLNLISDHDFKRWNSNELFEDSFWFFFIKDFNFFNIKKYKLSYYTYNPSLILNINQFFSTSFSYSNIPLFKSFFFKNKLYFYNIINYNVINYNVINYNVINYIYNNIIIKNYGNFFFYKYFISGNNSFFININLFYLFNFNTQSVYKLLIDFFINKNIFINYNNLRGISFFNFIDSYSNIVIYSQALDKIYKNMFKDGILDFNINYISNTKQNIPFLSSNFKLNSLKKNNNIFFNKIIFKTNLNNNLFLNNFNKIYYNFNFKFPYSISNESDIIRYTWFDWYSLKSLIITKAIDTSVFNLNNMKQYNYNFNLKTFTNSLQSDNFFFNNLIGRKLNNFSNIPFFFYKKNNLITFFQYFIYNNNYYYNYLFFIQSFYNNNNIYNPKLLNFFDNFFNNNTFNHSLYNNFIFNNYDDILILFNNILLKKNILLELYFNKNYFKNYLIFLNSSFFFKLNKLIFFKFNYNNSNTYSLYLKKLINFNFNKKNIKLKNQYLTMKKGISTMIRIQADKAVAMPIDTRLQILAVSKDIIHSWSIPSAGIKIDCIPGYSSHRLVIFLLSGIYWGQCMEICGRFHHWMPIVVYFMKRDLFFLWCFHFIFKNKQFFSINQNSERVSKQIFNLLNWKNSSWVYNI